VDAISVPPTPEITVGESDGGTDWLLLDHQVRVGKSIDSYYHRARRVVTPNGVESASELQIEFDPSYQTLLLHHVHIVRDGRHRDALRNAEVKVIQRESKLEERIYDGSLSCVVILGDVRVGDVVDFAYSINGANPILGGRYVDDYSLAEPFQVRRLRHRLLVPQDRKFTFRKHGTNEDPTIVSGTETVYVWDRHHAAAVVEEDKLPRWYDPTPWVQITEFETWNEVARWADDLFRAAAARANLKSQIEALRQPSDTVEDRLLRATRFVQDEIRYLGIELGPNSHRPFPPRMVLERRFGDCKDKALLLATLLAGLGVEARPALVNPELGRGLDTWAPSPFAFNHTIVEVKVSGTSYWIDPTISLQRGTLTARPSPDYERALVVARDSDGLSNLPRPKGGSPTVVVEEHFRATQATEPVSLEVVTTFRGADADEMRAQLADEPRSELAKRYLNYYARYDPKVAVESEPEVADDELKDEIVVRERYRIPGFWADEARDLVARSIGEKTARPQVTLRTMPLGITHPLLIAQTTEIELPQDFGLVSDSKEIHDDTFRFVFASTSKANKLTLRYTYETLRDHTPADQVAAYLRDLDSLDDELSYRLERPKTAHRGENGSYAYLFILPGLALAVGLVFVARRAPRAMRRISFRRRGALRSGEAPATALVLKSEEEWARHVRVARCSCGARWQMPVANHPVERVAFGGRTIRTVKFACPACGQGLSMFFRLLSD
jgi:transglutaminase-like putative cysteine protease